MQDRIWAITTYFNFGAYASKYMNYQVFRAQLGVPLLTVELATNGGFELGERDADILVRMSQGDVMWQQHRLFNVAVGWLPDDCEAVVFVDSDIVFGDPSWSARTLERLEHARLVQPFSQVQRLLPYQRQGRSGQTEEDGGFSLVPSCVLNETGTTGIAWATDRETAARGVFYDSAVMGGGDRLTVRAACGEVDRAVGDIPLSGAHEVHYRRWAENMYQWVSGDVGCVEGTVYTLWHGSGPNRRYKDRHNRFLKFDFDPAQDIEPAAGGAWLWANDKTDMHQYVKRYFYERREDGELMTGLVDGAPARLLKV